MATTKGHKPVAGRVAPDTVEDFTMRWKPFGTLLMLSMAVITAPAVAQDGPPGDGPPPRQDGDRPRGDRGGEGGGERRRNFDPEQMQQRMLERLKEQMDVPDDEWAVLKPKIQRVAEARREARAGMMGGMGRGPGGGGPGGGGGPEGGAEGQPPSPIAGAARDLRMAVQNDNANDADITAKLAAYRAAQEKAAADLKTARQELKELVSVHQEAVLVLAGLLE
jgi:hypothetical protein